MKAAPAPAVRQDKLDKLREGVKLVRDLEAEKEDLAARLKEINIKLEASYYKDLPDLLDEAGVTAIELPAEGNQPAVKAEAKPFYRANIPANWPQPQRSAAFAWLDDNGHGDLIKQTVEVAFARGERDLAHDFLKEVNDRGLNVEFAEGVHSATLTAWLREQVEKVGITPPLDIIGGTVGRIVKLKAKD